jgi:putative phosphoesterase
MRIAVISDTHMPRGARALPELCLARLAAADLVLHCGDLVTLAFLQQLEAIGPPVAAVLGNIDEIALHGMLPQERIVEAGGARIGMVHIPGPAERRAERLRARFPGCDAVVFGHTHVPVIERLGALWLLNPGSPTERRRAPRRTMLELSVEAEEIVPELVDLGR